MRYGTASIPLSKLDSIGLIHDPCREVQGKIRTPKFPVRHSGLDDRVADPVSIEVDHLSRAFDHLQVEHRHGVFLPLSPRFGALRFLPETRPRWILDVGRTVK